jgi:hypothetical protein
VPISPNDSLPIKEFASLFGFEPAHVVQAVEAQRYRLEKHQAFFTIPQLASRLQCSVPAVYKLLRSENAKIVNTGSGEKRKRILVDAATVARIEKSRTEKMAG